MHEHHSAFGSASKTSICAGKPAPTELRITVSGDGRAPKLESVKDAEEDNKVGGLGVFLIRALMDSVEYKIDQQRGARLVMNKRVTK